MNINILTVISVKKSFQFPVKICEFPLSLFHPYNFSFLLFIYPREKKCFLIEKKNEEKKEKLSVAKHVPFCERKREFIVPVPLKTREGPNGD